MTKKSGTLTSFTVPLDISTATGIVHYTLTIPVSLYADAFKVIYARTRSIVDDCVGARGFNNIDKFILIGGSTKLQLLRDTIAEDFDMPVHTGLNPDEAVAIGAAINSSVLLGTTQMTISDVLPQSIGIECYSAFGNQLIEGRFKKLITKDTPLPTSVTTQVTTIEPNQSSACIKVYQGEDSIAENNTYIGILNMQITPKEDKAFVAVTLSVDASGILSVKLTSDDNSESLVLNNVLRPAVQKKASSVDRFLKRYEFLLRKLQDSPELYEQGISILEDVKSGRTQFPVLKAFIDTHLAETRSEISAEINNQLAVLDQVASTSEFSGGDSESDEDSDDE